MLDALLCLQIDVEDSSDIKSGYKITFSFKENPFFQNRQLVKELLYSEDNALEVKCTEIDWTAEGVSGLACTYAFCTRRRGLSAVFYSCQTMIRAEGNCATLDRLCLLLKPKI